MANTMLTRLWLKLIDMPQFTTRVVTRAPTYNVEIYDTEG